MGNVNATHLFTSWRLNSRLWNVQMCDPEQVPSTRNLGLFPAEVPFQGYFNDWKNVSPLRNLSGTDSKIHNAINLFHEQ